MSAVMVDLLQPEHLPAQPRLKAANQWWPISIAIVALAIISRVGMIAWPFLNDSGLYAAMGRTVANGGVLYRDFYETKLPGAGLLAAAFWMLFGQHWAGYVLGELAMAIAAAIVLWRIVPTLPTFLYAIVFLNLSQAVYTGFQLETIQAFFEAIAAFFAYRALEDRLPWQSLAVGFFAGLAAMAKPGGAGIGLVFFILLMTRANKRWLHILLLACGFALPTGITAIYAVRTGAWSFLPGVVHDISNYATGTPIGAESVLKVGVVLSVLCFPFAIRLLGKKAAVANSPMLPFAVLWFFVDLAAVLMQRRLYPYHFLPIVCPAALLFGTLPRKATPVLLMAGLLPIALLSLTWEGSSISHISRGFEKMNVSSYVIDHTVPTDAVFSDQNGRLLIETGRQPGARLGTFFYFVNDDEAPHRYCSTLLNDFEQRQTKYLLLNTGWDRPIPALANCDILQRSPQRRQNFITAWDSFRKYVAQHYHLETTLDGVMIYRRNNVDQPANPSTRAPTSSSR